jgi:hypothetical protein
MDTQLKDKINAKLLREFRTLDGRPIYRVVWSPDEIETRKGTFTDFYGHIMIRQEHEAIRDVKKYWYLKVDCWVIEKLIFMPNEAAVKDLLEELVKARNGSYEPLYTFINGQNKPLPLDEEIVDYVIWQTQNPTKKPPSYYKDLTLKEEAAEVKYFENELGKNERSPLFVFENSAFVSTEQLKFKETYIEKTSPITLD